MAKTLQTMVTRIASEIRRPFLATPADMSSPIALAILDAISIYQKDRFRISDIDPSVPPSFPTVLGQSVYTVSSNPNIETIYVIDYLNLLIGATVEKMTRRTPEEILLLQQQNQQPILTTLGPFQYLVITGQNVPQIPPDGQEVLFRLNITSNATPHLSADNGFDYPIETSPGVSAGVLLAGVPHRAAFNLSSASWVLQTPIFYSMGMPSDFAYQGNKIMLYPIPSAVWTITIGGHVQIAAPAALAEDNNPWMNWAEQLIRSHAKYEIATHITRNPTMAQAMSPDAAGGPNGQPGETWRAWRRLKNESNKIHSVGRVRAMRW